MNDKTGATFEASGITLISLACCSILSILMVIYNYHFSSNAQKPVGILFVMIICYSDLIFEVALLLDMIYYGHLFGHSGIPEAAANVLMISASSISTGFPAAIAYEAYRCVFRIRSMEHNIEKRMAVYYTAIFGSVGIL